MVVQTRPRVIAYYFGGSARRKPPYRIADMPADRLTHVNYAFADVAADTGEISPGKHTADAEAHFDELLVLKERHPHLETLISVGGWTWSGNFSEAARTDESRQHFARSCAAFAVRYGFDGVDIDWEYPASNGMHKGHARDRRNFTLLLAELRRQLDAQGQEDGRRYLLTIAAPAGRAKIAVLEVDQIHRYLDCINVMTYDFAGGWSPVTAFNAPLQSTADPLQPRDDYTRHAHADAAIQALLDGGAPAEKLVLGVPFYGRGWKGVSPENDGLFQPHEGSADLSLRYRDLMAADLHGMERFWQPEAGVPWLYDADRRIMVSYDDPQSMRLKGAFAHQRGLGGVMFWEVSGDDAEHSLLGALVAGMEGG